METLPKLLLPIQMIWKRKSKKSQDRANHYYVMIRLNPGDEITKHKIDFKNDIY